jgi:hypothetical protein
MKPFTCGLFYFFQIFTQETRAPSRALGQALGRNVERERAFSASVGELRAVLLATCYRAGGANTP